VQAVLARTGGFEVYAEIGKRMPTVSDEVQVERFSLATSFILRAVADRARSQNQRRAGRQQLEQEAFVRNLIAMAAAGLSAPLSPPLT
jgi:hypothetical protein